MQRAQCGRFPIMQLACACLLHQVDLSTNLTQAVKAPVRGDSGASNTPTLLWCKRCTGSMCSLSCSCNVHAADSKSAPHSPQLHCTSGRASDAGVCKSHLAASDSVWCVSSCHIDAHNMHGGTTAREKHMPPCRCTQCARRLVGALI